MTCPCDNCIVMAMCKNRRIEDLISHCVLIKKFTEYGGRDNYPDSLGLYYDGDNYNMEKLRIVHLILKPSRWDVTHENLPKV